MHVDAAHEVAVTAKSTCIAGPVPTLGLVVMVACRTPGARLPLRSGEARHASQFDLVRQVVNVTSVLLLTHALVVMISGAALAHAVRVADKDLRDTVDLAEVDGLASAFVAQVADAALRARGVLVPGLLQPAIPPRSLLAACLLGCDRAS